MKCEKCGEVIAIGQHYTSDYEPESGRISRFWHADCDPAYQEER